MNIADWVLYFTSGTNWVIPVLVLWLAPWKIVALYRAARRGQWLSFLLFFALLPINTFGIVEMFYIFSWSKPKEIAVPMPFISKTKNEKGDKNNERADNNFGNTVFSPQRSVAAELANYKGPRREASEIKTFPQAEGMGRFNLADISKLEQMRKLSRESGAEVNKPSVAERTTVRPDVPIPKPPERKEDNVPASSAVSAINANEPNIIVETLMPGVFVSRVPTPPTAQTLETSTRSARGETETITSALPKIVEDSLPAVV